MSSWSRGAVGHESCPPSERTSLLNRYGITILEYIFGRDSNGASRGWAVTRKELFVSGLFRYNTPYFTVYPEKSNLGPISMSPHYNSAGAVAIPSHNVFEYSDAVIHGQTFSIVAR
jgi:hypothetical protein